MHKRITAALAIIAAALCLTTPSSAAALRLPGNPGSEAPAWQANTVPLSAPRPWPTGKPVQCLIRRGRPALIETSTPNASATAGHWYGDRLVCYVATIVGPDGVTRCLGRNVSAAYSAC